MQATINANTAKALIAALQGDDKVRHHWVKATDLLIADGVTSAMLSKKGDTELRDYVKKEIIVASFTAKDQALLEKETKTLSDDQKKAKREVQQAIGSKLGKIESHLKKAEKLAEEEAKTDAEREAEAEEAKKNATLKARLDKDLAAWIVRLEKCEANDFKSLPDVIKALKIAQTVCNA